MGSEKPYINDTDPEKLPFDSLDEYISYVEYTEEDKKMIEEKKKKKVIK